MEHGPETLPRMPTLPHPPRGRVLDVAGVPAVRDAGPQGEHDEQQQCLHRNGGRVESQVDSLWCTPSTKA
jgi:hypothetical protein